MQYKKNSFWLALQYIIAIVFSFFVLKLNLMHYGEELYGLWLLFFSFWVVGTSIDFGFGVATVKFIAESEAEEQKKIQVYTIGFIFFIISGIILFLIGNIAAHFIFFSKNEIIPQKYFGIATELFLILGINFYFQFVSLFFRSVLEGLKNFVLSSRIVITYQSINLLIVVLVFIFNYDIIFLAVLFTLSSVFYCIIFFAFIKKHYPYLKFKVSFINFPFFKHLLKFSFAVQFSSIFSALIDPVIKYIVGTFTGLNFVSFYEVGRRFAIAISGLFFNSFRTILPETSILKSEYEYKTFLMNDGVNLSNFGVVYSGFFYGFLIFFISVLIKVVFGYDEMILAFLLLCLPETVNNFGYVLYMFLIGIGKPYIISLIQILNLTIIALSLLLSFILFNSILGLFGYFFTVIVVNIIMLISVQRIAKISIREYLRLINTGKLLLLHALIIFGIIIISMQILSVYVSTFVISIISFFLFFKQFKVYYSKFFNLIRQGYA